MRKILNIVGLAALVSFSACESNNTATNEDAETLAADTTMIQDGLSPRGLPEETIPNNSTFDGDSMIVSSPQGSVALPEAVRNSVDGDNELKNKNIIDTRTFTRDGKIMYELTFEDGRNTKVTFDEAGNKVKY